MNYSHISKYFPMFKKNTKIVVSIVTSHNRIIKLFRRYNEKQYLNRFESKNDLFTHYYKTNRWGNFESVSGPGSTIKYTKNIRIEIPKLIDRFKIGCILDAPCGDYNWFRLIKRSNDVFYVGGDIVKPLVDRNNHLYGKTNTEFIQLDIAKDKLPTADLWICRDCLFHFSDKDVFRTMRNFIRSDIDYFLTSTHTELKKNENIATGSFRLLNLERPPFNFCKPLLYIDDWVEDYPVRKLGLWHRKTLLTAIASNKHLALATKNS